MKRLTKSNKKIDFTETLHTTHRKRKKTEIEYSNESLDNFSMIVISTTPTFSNHFREFISTSFGNSSPNKHFEVNSKSIFTPILKRWNKNNSSSNPNNSSVLPPEYITLNICSIELKLFLSKNFPSSKYFVILCIVFHNKFLFHIFSTYH